MGNIKFVDDWIPTADQPSHNHCPILYDTFAIT